MLVEHLAVLRAGTLSSYKEYLVWPDLCLSFYWGFPGSSESSCNLGDPGSITGSGRSPGEGLYVLHSLVCDLLSTWSCSHMA